MQLDNVRAWETPVALETEKASLTGSRRNDRRLMRIHTFLLVFNPIQRQLFQTYIFLLSLLNRLLVTEKLERLKGRGYSIYDAKFDRQENEYFKQF